MDQTPSNKPAGPPVAGSIVVILLWILSEGWDIVPPDAVVVAMVSVLGGALVWLIPTGRRVPPSAKKSLIEQGWQPGPSDRHLDPTIPK